MKKIKLLVIPILVSSLIITGCSKSRDNSNVNQHSQELKKTEQIKILLEYFL
jgi:outer membrane murein-binding lipoprotein Lpp